MVLQALALCRYLESNQEIVDLHDKVVLEIGAGTGLVSIVSSLLGAWVTATDLPEVLGNLRSNLSRNTRGRSRYMPQAAELFWGCKLDKTFPRSVYKYDYVLAADVVYHHDFLAELLVTMRHFCQPGTTLLWANRVRFQSDLVFTENFRKTFNISLLEDNGEIKIYSANVKEERGEVMEEGLKMENEMGAEESKNLKELKLDSKNVELQQRKLLTDATLVEEMKEVERKAELQDENQEGTEDDEMERLNDVNKETFEMEEKPVEIGGEDADRNSESHSTEKDKQQDYPRSWAPTIYYMPGKEIYHFLGQKIIIQESLDSYGATVWPAALALCKLLDTPEGRQQIHLCDKSVLELGAGTGLLSAVVTLLGAKLTATDLPEILGNLTCNLNRNTRGRRRHEPLIAELFWGHNLEETFPRSTNHYDYVLATDVVYHHDYLTELLNTMRHFCSPGTTLVWANKVRYARDLDFINDFQKCFNSSLLTERDEVRIYVATSRETEDAREEKATDTEKSHNGDVCEDLREIQRKTQNDEVKSSQSSLEEKYEELQDCKASQDH
ncbi:Protein-lysine methyltransferase METTL21C [Triplophysa tibetana]|uniref:Protein-lysine methyltransferase METTL21C n=1 Tax=Triplophysa tibetana TaxID=1572043 RepID=A0A5A9PLG5_9TELE|nr:Protein-lysine methyltransferase METTL21C [Triplophysa tibetana]